MLWPIAKRLCNARLIRSFIVFIGIVGAFTAGSLLNQRTACPSTDMETALPCYPKQQQSPINLQPIIQAPLTPLQYDYRPVPLTVLHNRHTLQVNYPPGSALALDQEHYPLEEVIFQTPSEHTVADMPYAMEAQLVHRRSDRVVIVGVFIEIGEANSVIQKIWEHMPVSPGSKKSFNDVTINVADLLPEDLGAYYRYSGSVTDPPYDEGVTWIVMREPITISVAQLERFVNAMGPTARPVQPSNHRLILEAS